MVRFAELSNFLNSETKSALFSLSNPQPDDSRGVRSCPNFSPADTLSAQAWGSKNVQLLQGKGAAPWQKTDSLQKEQEANQSDVAPALLFISRRQSIASGPRSRCQPTNKSAGTVLSQQWKEKFQNSVYSAAHPPPAVEQSAIKAGTVIGQENMQWFKKTKPFSSDDLPEGSGIMPLEGQTALPTANEEKMHSSLVLNCRDRFRCRDQFCANQRIVSSQDSMATVQPEAAKMSKICSHLRKTTQTNFTQEACSPEGNVDTFKTNERKPRKFSDPECAKSKTLSFGNKAVQRHCGSDLVRFVSASPDISPSTRGYVEPTALSEVCTNNIQESFQATFCQKSDFWGKEQKEKHLGTASPKRARIGGFQQGRYSQGVRNKMKGFQEKEHQAYREEKEASEPKQKTGIKWRLSVTSSQTARAHRCKSAACGQPALNPQITSACNTYEKGSKAALCLKSGLAWGKEPKSTEECMAVKTMQQAEFVAKAVDSGCMEAQKDCNHGSLCGSVYCFNLCGNAVQKSPPSLMTDMVSFPSFAVFEF